MQAQFRGRDCEVLLQRYPDGSPRLQLWSEQAPGPVATASVNLADCGVAPEREVVCVKSSGENKGIVEALLMAGAIAPPIAWLRLGYGLVVALCPLSPALLGWESPQRN